MSAIISLIPDTPPANEADAEIFAAAQLKAAGYDLTMRASRSPLLKKHWPSKAKVGKAAGFPDMLLHLANSEKPIGVWENKSPTETAMLGLREAKFYVEGLRLALPNEPALPFIAAGYNGSELLVSVYTNDGKWVPLRANGKELRDAFPIAEVASIGISSTGEFTAANGSASAHDLRALLPKLKTLYRNIPTLASGRTPIDFTIALLTLKLIVEQSPDWGTWSEIPRFSPGSTTEDHAIGERFETLTKRVMSDVELRRKYGDIFDFHEKSDTLEIAFSFSDTLSTIPKGTGHFSRLFQLLDELPPLTGADFDIFGEVYQSIGDEATKKKLGEFFTGRHIIAGVLPVLFDRTGLSGSFDGIEKLRIADIACGTGGFLTEILRFLKKEHSLAPDQIKEFSKKSFFGYDLGHANASRARVNMYFAGDGFSVISGGFDSLSKHAPAQFPSGGFDIIATNPPYGKSSYGRLEEAFLERTIESIRKGSGWALVVLPTGVLENPRSSKARFALLNQARVTDVISLPKHAFAPYTQQRTAVVIAQRRKDPLVAKSASWADLLAAAGHEKVNMFIVDNDGFANSDKRYATDLRNTAGEWMHNDLAPWIGTDGVLRESKVFMALVHGQAPKDAIDEVGQPLEAKHGVFTLAALADHERGVALLPDIPLRAELRSIALKQWEKRVDDLLAYSRGEDVALPTSFKEELGHLLDYHLELAPSSLSPSKPIRDLFDPIRKGDTSLTEAAIYKSFDPKGYPVYGGGGGRPKFHAAAQLTRSNGVAASLFEGPAVIVSMDGSSGSIQVVESGKFFCNHHGAVLKPKQGVNVWAFAQIAEPALRRLASNQSGSATLTKPALEGLELQMPKGAVADRIGSRRQALSKLAKMLRG
ncbi:N-6 DNA methylase [Brevundimonas sp. M20]|uniref:N-6 DNA methylase n=1 Tax=Brevundimonas sp. M20 TaxID=2591463 RepID=UPI001146AF3C|nr:N-6 DNA methylase [Brevundimonas sp. M20]QDH72221.1 SAM-dependent DNA methyltransferase [Brevundimonas sp. M20]